MNNATRIYKAYTPLDELLEQPGIRILRALRFHDWVTTSTLLDAGLMERTAADDRALYRLVEAGHVERKRTVGHHAEYRITAAGKAHLVQRLQSPLLVATEREMTTNGRRGRPVGSGGKRPRRRAA